MATIAEVEVNRLSGAVRVKRLVCAHDCGLIVNPEALRGAVQANLIQSLGRALKEEVTVDKSHVTSVDWNSYPVVRWLDGPEIEIVPLNRPEIASSGAGEPSSRPAAAAIHNAVFRCGGGAGSPGAADGGQGSGGVGLGLPRRRAHRLPGPVRFCEANR